MFLSSTPAGRWNQIWVLFLAVEFIYCARWLFISPQWISLVIGWAMLFVVEHFWWNRHTFRTVIQAAKEYESSDRRLSFRWLANLLIDLPIAFVTLFGPFVVLETTVVGSILSKHLSYMWFNPFPQSVRWMALTAILGNTVFLILSTMDGVSHEFGLKANASYK